LPSIKKWWHFKTDRCELIWEERAHIWLRVHPLLRQKFYYTRKILVGLRQKKKKKKKKGEAVGSRVIVNKHPTSIPSTG
jgi:hypothetical protein